MAKEKILTNEEKAQIDVLHQQGFNNVQIGRIIGRTEGAVRYHLKNKENPPKKRGPKPKLSPSAQRLVLRTISNSTLSVNQVRAQLKLNVSKSTVRRCIKKCKNLQFKKMLKKQQLKPIHKTKRLQWAREYMGLGEKWKYVIWSHEKNGI